MIYFFNKEILLSCKFSTDIQFFSKKKGLTIIACKYHWEKDHVRKFLYRKMQNVINFLKFLLLHYLGVMVIQ